VNVGNGILVYFTDFSLAGSGTGNYTLVQPSGVTADITPVLPDGEIEGSAAVGNSVADLRFNVDKLAAEGWKWNAAEGILTLGSGYDPACPILFETAGAIRIDIAGTVSISVPGTALASRGSLSIESGALSLESASDSALAVGGDLLLSGTLRAVTDGGAPAIRADGDVSLVGGASVTAEGRGADGRGISAGGDIVVDLADEGRLHAAGTGAGCALEAEKIRFVRVPDGSVHDGSVTLTNRDASGKDGVIRGEKLGSDDNVEYVTASGTGAETEPETEPGTEPETEPTGGYGCAAGFFGPALLPLLPFARRTRVARAVGPGPVWGFSRAGALGRGSSMVK
jgi:hypothetical protein